MKPGLALVAVATVVVLAEVMGFAYWRSAVAVIMFVTIMWLGLSYFRSIRPANPDQVEDVRAQDLKYVCTMCGLELKVEWDAVDKPAPRHCREAMKLVTEDGSPPLRSV